MTALVERALEQNPALDPASVEAGVRAALEATKDLLHEQETTWYHSAIPGSRAGWRALRDFSNDFYQLDKVAQT